MDWTGYERGSRGKQAGFVRCLKCGTEWGVPKCWLERPSPQCQAVLTRHRKECGIPAGQRSGGPGSGPPQEQASSAEAEPASESGDQPPAPA
jgi:hypothetical protein